MPTPRRILGWLVIACAASVGAAQSQAADYAWLATVTSVSPGFSPDCLVVGQGLAGSVGFDETLVPGGFVDPGMTTSFFEHPTPNDRLGVHVAVGRMRTIHRDPADPQRIERTAAGSDFVMRTTALFEDVAPYVACPQGGPISVELALEDLVVPVDYLTLPDPLVPVLPSAVNRLILTADGGFHPSCVVPGSCVAVAEIDSFLADSDGDGDGLLDSIDTCVDVYNGFGDPFSCDQRDGDDDGYGNACDTDLNNDGATGLDDTADMLGAASILPLGPVWDRFDINCDFAAGLDDVSVVFQDAVSVATPGPSGLACAGEEECP